MEKSSKILIFSTSYYPFVGGAEVAVKEITDRISNIQFDLITGRFDRRVSLREKIGNVNIYRLGLGVSILDKLLLPFWGAIFALYLNGKNKYDNFWCIMVTFASGAAYLANLIHFWKQVPVILTLQEGDSEKHFKYRWFGLINLSWRLAFKNTSFLTVISSYLAVRARNFGYKGKLEIIPNGVDIKSFELRGFSLEERQETRKDLGLKDDDIGLVTTSRLVIKNGVEDVIKALVKLPNNVKFVIFGEGKLKEKLKDLVQKLKVSERVIFRGFVSHDEMAKYLKAYDIFIRPSLSEGMGNSFIEAMAAKVPVIATPVGGIIDFLHDSPSKAEIQTGYFCQPEDPESVAETVKRVINDPRKEEVLENAYNMVVEKYNWDLISKQMSEVFNRSHSKGRIVRHDFAKSNKI